MVPGCLVREMWMGQCCSEEWRAASPPPQRRAAARVERRMVWLAWLLPRLRVAAWPRLLARSQGGAQLQAIPPAVPGSHPLEQRAQHGVATVDTSGLPYVSSASTAPCCSSAPRSCSSGFQWMHMLQVGVRCLLTRCTQGPNIAWRAPATLLRPRLEHPASCCCAQRQRHRG